MGGALTEVFTFPTSAFLVSELILAQVNVGEGGGGGGRQWSLRILAFGTLQGLQVL